jgi:hypothetical protein
VLHPTVAHRNRAFANLRFDPTNAGDVASRIANIAAIATSPTGHCGVLGDDLNEVGGTQDPDVVATVTLIGTAAVPLTMADVGETVHVEFAGAPEQVKLTVCAKPPIGVTLKPNVALCPALTVEVDGEVAVAVKSGVAGACVLSMLTMPPA